MAQLVGSAGTKALTETIVYLYGQAWQRLNQHDHSTALARPERRQLDEIDYGLKAAKVIKYWITVYDTKGQHSALNSKRPNEASWLVCED